MTPARIVSVFASLAIAGLFAVHPSWAFAPVVAGFLVIAVLSCVGESEFISEMRAAIRWRNERLRELYRKLDAALPAPPVRARDEDVTDRYPAVKL